MRLELLLIPKPDKEPFMFDDYVELKKKIFEIFNDLKINQPHIKLNDKSVLIKINLCKTMGFQNAKVLDELYLKIIKNSSLESVFDMITLYSDSSLYFSRKLYQLVYFSEIEIRKMLCMLLAGAIGSNWYKLVKRSIEKRKDNISKNATNLENFSFIHYVDLFDKKYNLNEILNELEKFKINDDIIKNHSNSQNLLILWFIKELQLKSDEFKEQINTIREIRNSVAHNKTLTFNYYEKNQKFLKVFLNNIKQINKIIETTNFNDFEHDLEKIHFKLIFKQLNTYIKRIFNSICL